MAKTAPKKSLLDAYRFDNFKTGKMAKGRFGDKTALVLSLSRRSKKVCVSNVALGTGVGTTGKSNRSEIYRAAIAAFTLSSRSGVFVVERPVW